MLLQDLEPCSWTIFLNNKKLSTRKQKKKGREEKRKKRERERREKEKLWSTNDNSPGNTQHLKSERGLIQ